MKAWELLETSGWCQGAEARSFGGKAVSAEANVAASFCLVGAVIHTYGERAARPIIVKLWSVVRTFSPAEWNDDPSRTKEEVVALLRELNV